MVFADPKAAADQQRIALPQYGDDPKGPGNTNTIAEIRKGTYHQTWQSRNVFEKKPDTVTGYKPDAARQRDPGTPLVPAPVAHAAERLAVLGFAVPSPLRRRWPALGQQITRTSGGRLEREGKARLEQTWTHAKQLATQGARGSGYEEWRYSLTRGEMAGPIC